MSESADYYVMYWWSFCNELADHHEVNQMIIFLINQFIIMSESADHYVMNQLIIL